MSKSKKVIIGAAALLPILVMACWEAAEPTPTAPTVPPTATATLPPTPTATPEPTPTPMPPTATPEATPTPEPISDWIVNEGKPDAISGQSLTSVIAEGDWLDGGTGTPAILLTCFDDGLGALVHTGGRYLAANVRTDEIDLVWRVGGYDPVEVRAYETPSNNAARLSRNDSRRLVNFILRGDSIAVRMTSYDDTTLTAGFPTRNLRDHAAALPCYAWK